MTSRRSELLLKKCNIQHFDKNKPGSLKYPPRSHTQFCQSNLTEHGDTALSLSLCLYLSLSAVTNCCQAIETKQGGNNNEEACAAVTFIMAINHMTLCLL